MLVEKNMPKKVVASKCHRGSSFSEYDQSQFVYADTEAFFHDSITRRFGIREKGFDIDVENAQVEGFQRVIHSRG